MTKFRCNYQKSSGVVYSSDLPSMTKQEFKNDVNMNSIMKRYRSTGILPVSNAKAVFGDFSKVYDYQTAVQKVMEIDEEFLKLPSHVRERYGNNPDMFMQAISNHQGLQALINEGIIKENSNIKVDDNDKKDIIEEKK